MPELSIAVSEKKCKTCFCHVEQNYNTSNSIQYNTNYNTAPH